MPQLAIDILWVVFLPLSWFYGCAASIVIAWKKSQRVKIPVISVGNIHTGGTGKTPLVVQIASHFTNLNPAIVSRGYQGKLSSEGAVCDLSKENGPKLFGDEPYMMSQKTSATVYVGASRLKLIKKFSIDDKHGLIILDDGFQHKQIYRDVDILVLPGELSPWDSSCLPLGNLREPLRAIRRASCVVITCSSSSVGQTKDWISLVNQVSPSLPVFVAERFLDLEWPESVAIGGFCGIAHPHRFKNDLEQKGPVTFFKCFSDHHQYKKSDIDLLMGEAKKAGLRALITTEKDFDKVAPFFQNHHFGLFAAQARYDLPEDFIHFIESRVA